MADEGFEIFKNIEKREHKDRILFYFSKVDGSRKYDLCVKVIKELWMEMFESLILFLSLNPEYENIKGKLVDFCFRENATVPLEILLKHGHPLKKIIPFQIIEFSSKQVLKFLNENFPEYCFLKSLLKRTCRFEDTNFPMFQFLVEEMKVDVDFKDDDQITFEMVEFLVQKHPQIIQANATFIFENALKQRHDIVNYFLIKKGFAPPSFEKEQWLETHFSLDIQRRFQFMSFETIQHVQDGLKLVTMGNLSIFNHLLEMTSESFHIALFFGILRSAGPDPHEALEILLDHGKAKVDLPWLYKNRYGHALQSTPLHLLCQSSDRTKSFHLLLKWGANLWAEDCLGLTPFEGCLLGNNEKLLKAILQVHNPFLHGMKCETVDLDNQVLFIVIESLGPFLPDCNKHLAKTLNFQTFIHMQVKPQMRKMLPLLLHLQRSPEESPLCGTRSNGSSLFLFQKSIVRAFFRK